MLSAVRLGILLVVSSNKECASVNLRTLQDAILNKDFATYECKL